MEILRQLLGGQGGAGAGPGSQEAGSPVRVLGSRPLPGAAALEAKAAGRLPLPGQGPVLEENLCGATSVGNRSGGFVLQKSLLFVSCLPSQPVVSKDSSLAQLTLEGSHARSTPSPTALVLRGCLLRAETLQERLKMGSPIN